MERPSAPVRRRLRRGTRVRPRRRERSEARDTHVAGEHADAGPRRVRGGVREVKGGRSRAGVVFRARGAPPEKDGAVADPRAVVRLPPIRPRSR
eukprot:21589-Pelagococcus_subviridis.AAC.1